MTKKPTRKLETQPIIDANPGMQELLERVQPWFDELYKAGFTLEDDEK